MILYDSHNWFAMLRFGGSVFPKAVLFSMPSALLSATISSFRYTDWYIFEAWSSALKDGTVLSGFTFVLGFMLVFRAQQAYNRYWVAATSAHNMATRFYEACSNIVAFSTASKKAAEVVEEFNHTTVRLFCLLHAVALEELAELMNEDFPLIDVESLDKKDLSFLCAKEVGNRKVEVVYQWIKVHIVKGMDFGVFSVAPPILSRIFQELGNGLVSFHQAHQVVVWPFPYCYAQISCLLLMIYLAITPFMISLLTSNIAACFFFTLTSSVCMLGVQFIATELEHPFGEDANDLPCFEMQNHINQDLLLLLHPNSCRVPALLPGYMRHCHVTEGTASLAMMADLESGEECDKTAALATNSGVSPKTASTNAVSKKLRKQHAWAAQSCPPHQTEKIRQALKLTGGDTHPEMGFGQPPMQQQQKPKDISFDGREVSPEAKKGS